MRVALTLAGLLLGVTVGVGVYTFIYARGYSYLSNNPGACTNCHVMRGYYDAWIQSSHHAGATCNDCHTPASFLPKYATKLTNGFMHSFAFTSGRFPDAIQIKARSQAVTEAACRHCHQDLVTGIEGVHRMAASASCVHCHASVGHAVAVAQYPQKEYYP